MELLPVEESACYRWRRPRIGEIEPFTRWVLAATVIVALGDALGQGSLLNGQPASWLLPAVGILFLACQVHRYRRRCARNGRG